MDGLTRDTTPSKLFQKVANNQKIRIFALKNVLRHKYAIRHAKREVADYLDKQRTPPNNERGVVVFRNTVVGKSVTEERHCLLLLLRLFGLLRQGEQGGRRCPGLRGKWAWRGQWS